MKLPKFSSIKGFIKKRKGLAILFSAILLLVVVVGVSISKRNKAPTFEYYNVLKGNVVQEVTATGKVKPATSIDYSFETSGKVNTVNVSVGDQVKPGQILAVLKNNDLKDHFLFFSL